MIELETFKKSIEKFDKLESRTNFFASAQKLLKNGFETEGMLLILATWNFALFRYETKKFDIDRFSSTLAKLEPHFQKLSSESFATINLDDYAKSIKFIYTTLSNIKGIQYTGAPKLMHLKCPNVFVMWDGYIRGEKSRKYYADLKVFKSSVLPIKKYKTDAQSYLEFLKDMQVVYGKLPLECKGKTLAKAIDEYNYVNITLPIQKKEKQNRKPIQE